MKDVQKQIDERNVYLNQVGIKDFMMPMEISIMIIRTMESAAPKWKLIAVPVK